MSAGCSEIELDQSCKAVCDAVNHALERSGLGGVRASRLASELGISRTLSQRLNRALLADSPRKAFFDLPSGRGLKLVIDGLSQLASIRNADVQRVQEAVDAYTLVLSREPGGWSALADRLRSTSPEGPSASSSMMPDARLHRALHRNEAALVRCKVRLANTCELLRPHHTGKGIDVAQVAAKYDLQRLAAGPPITLSGSMVRAPRSNKSSDTDILHHNLASDPICAEDDYLLSQFCSSPTPKTTRVRIEQPDGIGEAVLLPGDSPAIGESVDVVFGRQRSAVSLPNNEELCWRTQTLTVPATRMIRDTLIHRSLIEPGFEFRAGAHTHAWQWASGAHFGITHGHDELGIDIKPRVLESADLNLDPREGGSFAAFLLERTGQQLSDYVCYRLTLEYPPTRYYYSIWFGMSASLRAHLDEAAQAQANEAHGDVHSVVVSEDIESPLGH